MQLHSSSILSYSIDDYYSHFIYFQSDLYLEVKVIQILIYFFQFFQAYFTIPFLDFYIHKLVIYKMIQYTIVKVLLLMDLSPTLFQEILQQIDYNNMKNNKKKQNKPAIIQQTEYVPKSIIPHSKGYALIIGAKPNSKQSKIMEINDEYIGIAIAAPPKQGQANEELVSHIALVLGVKKNTVYLDKGSKSRNKVAIVQSTQLTLQSIYNKLRSDMQQ